MPLIPSHEKLTAKQEALCAAFVKGANKIEAFKLAYDTTSDNYDSVRTMAYQVFDKPHIKARIKELREIAYKENEMTLSELVHDLATMIRFDPAEMYEQDGTLKSIHDMPRHVRQMIVSIDTEELFMGKGNNRELYGLAKKVKVYSKLEAMEKLMKHLGGYEKDNDQKKSVQQIAIFQLPDNGRTPSTPDPAQQFPTAPMQLSDTEYYIPDSFEKPTLKIEDGAIIDDDPFPSDDDLY